MAARIERWDVRVDGPLSEEALQRKVELLGYEVAARTYPAGVSSASFSYPREGITAVVRGIVKLTIDSEPELLTAGDLMFVPASAQRYLEVVGPATALCLEAFKQASTK